MSRFLIFDLIQDWPYWGVPFACRECAFLEACRRPIYRSLRCSCYDGCRRARARRYTERREDFWAALLADEQNHE